MGLDTTHNCWHGPYSAFSHWRNCVARAAGYTVLPVDWGDFTRESVLIDWGHIFYGWLLGEWDATPEDPLMVLITHSDCDGVIHPEQAGPLADRLEELLPRIEGTSEVPGRDTPSMQAWTRQFIDGLRMAVEAGEDVGFH